jgi:hypothetical protein
MTDHLLQSFCWPQAIAVFGGSPDLHRSCRRRHRALAYRHRLPRWTSTHPVILHEEGSGLGISDALILPKE